MAGIGDITGDGVGDFAVGAPGDGEDDRRFDGAVFLYSSRNVEPIRRIPLPAEYRDEHDAPGFGSAVAGIGDRDGDRVPDLAVGAPGTRVRGIASAGVVVFVSGRSGEVLRRIEGGANLERLGQSVAGSATDRGIADVLVGAPTSRGRKVLLYRGSEGDPELALADPTGAGRYFGGALCFVGDVDRDGVPDFTVGAFDEPSGEAEYAGSARTYSGLTGRECWVVRGDRPDACLGSSVGSAGDLDGDGVPDLLVGAPGPPQGDPEGLTGSVLILSGATGSRIRVLPGKSAGERFGESVSGGVDLDGDLVPDVIVGAPGAPTDAGHSAGRVAVHSGRDGSLLYEIRGDEPGGQLGHSIAVAGDVDGDRVPDVLAGAPYGLTVRKHGLVYVVSGAKGQVLRVLRRPEGESR